MDDQEVLAGVKFNLGLSSDIRDEGLLKIIEGAKAELANSGISPEGQDGNYCSEYWSYLIAHCAWLYRSRDGAGEYPRFLRLRRNNLIFGADDVQP